MKIIYLHQYFVTPAMSGGTRSYEWATRLVARGHEVHVVTSDQRRGAASTETIEGGVRVHWLAVPYDNQMSVPRRLFAFVQFAILAGLRARKLRGDLVVATSTPLTIAIPALFSIWGRHTPMVFEVRDLWPEVPIAMGGLKNPLAQRAALALERAAYRNATRIVALSPEMRAGVRHVGFPADKISLVPNAADLDLFRRDGVEEEGRRFRSTCEWLGDRPLVLYAGTLGRVNAVSSLVDIAAESREVCPDARFLVVGQGAEHAAVESLATRLGVLGHNFFMLPSVPKDAMPALLAAATITTSLIADIPALAGNSANKVFDGLAAGRPVALNAEGSLGDMLRQTGAGIVLNRDPKEAARQLRDFLGDPRVVSRAREAADRLAREVFDRDVLFAEFANAIEGGRAEGRVVRKLTPLASVTVPGSIDSPWWLKADSDEGA